MAGDEGCEGERAFVPGSDEATASGGGVDAAEARDVGREGRVLRASVLLSLDSWRQTMLGCAAESVSFTMVHLSSSPRPRMFHETSENEIM
jgi:hypothetical protein